MMSGTKPAHLLMLMLAMLVAAGGCSRPTPPSVPELGGPGAGQPGETLHFRVRSTDRNGGNLCYLCDWGDNTPARWGAELAAGETMLLSHVFEAAGGYEVRAKARDETGLESGWSGKLALSVAFVGPERPAQPEGPTQVWPDTVWVFESTAGHVADESVSIQFDWGDGLGRWSVSGPPGSPVQDTHTFKVTGDYEVRARGRDAKGNVSPWSIPLSVAVVPRPVEPPSGLRLSQSSGVYVRVRWNPGRNSDSTRYVVWFRSLDSSRFTAIDSVVGLACLHDPIGATGEYTVSARLGGSEVFSAETVSTVPLRTDTVIVFELNAAGMSGYGWDSLTRRGRLLPMTDTALAGMTAWYLTDLSPGHSGPGYYLASPHVGPDDPGGIVPPGTWPRTGLLRIWGSSQEPLPEFDTLLYQDRTQVGSAVSDVAVYVSGGHYALVRTFEPDMGLGKCPVVTWFQPVRGLRLIRHQE
ncbi:MAG: hypothetical protein ABIK37_00135 [candidate division WOR-3 bacterium]